MKNQVLRALRPGLPGTMLGLILAGPLAAQDDDVEYTPNYRDTELLEVVNAISSVTGRVIIPDPRAAGIRVSLYSTEPMNEDQFWQAFLQMLSQNGLVVVQSAGITRIVPDAQLRFEASPLGGGTGAELVTDTITLENVQAAQLVPVLRPMVGQNAHLAAAAGGANMLIIVDRADNVSRMARVVRAIDRAGAQDATIVPLQYATAEEVALKLTQMVQVQSAGGTAMLQAIADERTNSVLLAGTPSQINRFRDIATSLDLPATQGGGARVRYLNYADAESMAEILQSQFGGVIVEDAEAAAQLTGGSVAISFDANTNALVMNAPSRVLQDMVSIIEALDIPRAQVHVQAIIVEMSQDRAAQLGLTWALDGASGESAAALTNFGGSTTGLLDLAVIGSGGTPDPSSIGEGITAAIGRLSDSGTSWAAVISALAGDGDTNVISLPELVVLDNAEATISVGQEVPFLTGQYADAGGNIGAVNPFQTIDRQKVGTSLVITPRINEGTGMRLTIEQVTSGIAGGAEGASDLITNEREITTEVFVNDGDILILGGLLDDQLRETEQRVPGLGKIPLLGALFRERRTEHQKQNLMVFIRPTILRDSLDASRLSGNKYRALQEVLRENDEPVQLMRKDQRPALPDLDDLPESGSTAPAED